MILHITITYGMTKSATIIIKTAYPLSSSTVNPDEIKTG